MKLYRGLKSSEYQQINSAQLEQYKADWKLILARRDRNDLSFGHEIAPIARRLKKTLRLTRQYFTDNESIAKKYAKNVQGICIQMDVPIEDILTYFTLDFQNYNKRKERFEIVYLVDALTLNKMQTVWDLKVIPS